MAASSTVPPADVTSSPSDEQMAQATNNDSHRRDDNILYDLQAEVSAAVLNVTNLRNLVDSLDSLSPGHRRVLLKDLRNRLHSQRMCNIELFRRMKIAPSTEKEHEYFRKELEKSLTQAHHELLATKLDSSGEDTKDTDDVIDVKSPSNITTRTGRARSTRSRSSPPHLESQERITSREE